MGHWKIEIDGMGIHHNKRPDDAEAMTADFVAAMRAKGHTISGAKLTLVGSATPATDVLEVLASRDPKGG